jgi:hypothetical protein
MERPEKEAREKEAKEAAEKARMLESFADAPDWSDEEEEEEESESGSAAIEPQHTAVDSQHLATAANTSRHPVPAELQSRAWPVLGASARDMRTPKERIAKKCIPPAGATTPTQCNPPEAGHCPASC